MKKDYSKQVKRFQESIAIIKLGDEIIEKEKKRLKRQQVSKVKKSPRKNNS